MAFHNDHRERGIQLGLAKRGKKEKRLLGWTSSRGWGALGLGESSMGAQAGVGRGGDTATGP